MADYIDRQAAMELLIKRLHETGHNNFNVPIFASDLCFEIADERLANWVNEIPSADVVPVRRGRWAKVESDNLGKCLSEIYVCSNCGVAVGCEYFVRRDNCLALFNNCEVCDEEELIAAWNKRVR